MPGPQILGYFQEFTPQDYSTPMTDENGGGEGEELSIIEFVSKLKRFTAAAALVSAKMSPSTLTAQSGGSVTITLTAGGFGTTPHPISWGTEKVTPPASDWTDDKITLHISAATWNAGSNPFTFTFGGIDYTTDTFTLT